MLRAASSRPPSSRLVALAVLGLEILVLGLVSACGSDGGGGGNDDGTIDLGGSRSRSEYTYDYTVNGCATGKQTFSSKEAFCAGLLDDARNKGCARSLREETHTRECR